MYTTDEIDKIDFTVDQSNLYLEESFTDLRLASIRRLTPVKANGIKDKNRKPLFMGQTQVMTPQGPFPIQVLLDARNLKEAMEKFPGTMKTAMLNMMDQLKKAEPKEESRIIIPGS